MTDASSRATPPAPAGPARRTLVEALASYASPDVRVSIWQLVSSLTAFIVLWTLAFLSLELSYGISLIAAVPAAIVLVRLFIIQHDCAHRSFLPSARANDILGSILSVLTLTPHAYWRRVHALHHASSGNLDRRGLGDIDTLTVREYLALGHAARVRYRILRNPMVILVAGPVYQFFVHHRLPANLPRRWRREWRSVVLTNAALAGAIAVAWQTVGIGRFVMVHLPITWLAGSIGIWLFYVQHQFEHAYWVPDEDWDFETASVRGSSFLDLPPLLHWCTGYIGYHHVHHVSPRIPNYRLRASAGAHPALAAAPRLTLTDAVTCLGLKLWDEERKRLVGFDSLVGSRARDAT